MVATVGVNADPTLPTHIPSGALYPGFQWWAILPLIPSLAHLEASQARQLGFAGWIQPMGCTFKHHLTTPVSLPGTPFSLPLSFPKWPIGMMWQNI